MTNSPANRAVLLEFGFSIRMKNMICTGVAQVRKACSLTAPTGEGLRCTRAVLVAFLQLPGWHGGMAAWKVIRGEREGGREEGAEKGSGERERRKGARGGARETEGELERERERDGQGERGKERETEGEKTQQEQK